MFEGKNSQQVPEAPVQTITKTKTKTNVALVIMVGVIAIVGSMLLGLFSANAAASAFKVAGGRPDNPGGGGGGGGKDKPSLQVSLSNEVTNQTVVAGTNNHTFTKIVLDASELTQHIQINEINFNVTTSNNTSPNEVTTFELYPDGNSVSIPTINNPSAGTEANNTGIKFTFVSPIVVTSGTTQVLELKGDIDNTAIDGVYQVGIQKPQKGSKIKVVDATTVNRKKISINYQYSNGPEMTFIQEVIEPGILLITQHVNTPDAGFMPGDTSGVTLTSLLVEAQDKDIEISKIYFTGEGVNGGGWDQVYAFHVYNGATLVGSPTVTTTDSYQNATVLLDITNAPIVVPQDGTVTLTLKADTSTVNGKDGSKGESFKGITVKINGADDVTARDIGTGQDSTVIISNATGNPQYLVRSFPTVSLDESGGTIPGGTSTLDLHSFTVWADSANDIGLLTVSYRMNVSNVTVTNIFLYQGSTRVARVSPTLSNSNNSEQLTFVLTTDGQLPSGDNLLPSNSVISAGSSRTYSLKADVECSIVDCNSASNPTGGSVSVKFLNDVSSVGTSPISATTLSLHKFFWTDFWMTPTLQRSSPDVLTANQWLNGWLINQTNGNDLEATSTGAHWWK